MIQMIRIKEIGDKVKRDKDKKMQTTCLQWFNNYLHLFFFIQPKFEVPLSFQFPQMIPHT